MSAPRRRVIHSRSARGKARVRLDTRVSASAKAAVRDRAAAEAAGVESEMTRRLLAYAMAHMPKGWTP